MTDLAQLVAQLEPGLGRRSAYLDLADGLRTLIMDGRLVAGDRLPPQRTLAGALRVSRTTVVSSLTLLRAEGLLSSRQGSASTVCAPPERIDRPDEPSWLNNERPAIDLSMAVLPAAREVVPGRSAGRRAATGAGHRLRAASARASRPARRGRGAVEPGVGCRRGPSRS